MNDFLRLFLPIYGLIFFFCVFFLRTVLVWKRTGVNAYVLLKSGGPQAIIGRYFKVLPMLSTLVILIYSFLPEYYYLLSPFIWMQSQTLIGIGLVLLITSLVWVWVSQTQMGNSWRIGVDETERTELVTNGVFSISRNPIFLGMKLNSLGFFFVVPNAISLVVLLMGIALIDVQVAMEEKFLSSTQGEKYHRYRTDVRRWI